MRSDQSLTSLNALKHVLRCIRGGFSSCKNFIPELASRANLIRSSQGKSIVVSFKIWSRDPLAMYSKTRKDVL